jgi:hypothetical protein
VVTGIYLPKLASALIVRYSFCKICAHDHSSSVALGCFGQVLKLVHLCCGTGHGGQAILAGVGKIPERHYFVKTLFTHS